MRRLGSYTVVGCDSKEPQLQLFACWGCISVYHDPLANEQLSHLCMPSRLTPPTVVQDTWQHWVLAKSTPMLSNTTTLNSSWCSPWLFLFPLATYSKALRWLWWCHTFHVFHGNPRTSQVWPDPFLHDCTILCTRSNWGWKQDYIFASCTHTYSIQAYMHLMLAYRQHLLWCTDQRIVDSLPKRWSLSQRSYLVNQLVPLFHSSAHASSCQCAH